MKKSKIINLVLLTVAVAATEKSVTAQTVENGEFKSTLLSGYAFPANATNSSVVSYGSNMSDDPVVRNGFGQDDKHRGAEQNHDNNEKN